MGVNTATEPHGVQKALSKRPRSPVSPLALWSSATVESCQAVLTNKFVVQVATVFLGQAMTSGVTMLDLQPDTTQAARVFGKTEAGAGPDEQRRRADDLWRIPGMYFSADLNMTVTLLVSDGVVVMRRPKATDIRFSAFSGDLFTNGERMLLFVLRDDGGAVTGFTLTAGRVRDLPFTRKDGKPGSER